MDNFFKKKTCFLRVILVTILSLFHFELYSNWNGMYFLKIRDAERAPAQEFPRPPAPARPKKNLRPPAPAQNFSSPPAPARTKSILDIYQNKFVYSHT